MNILPVQSGAVCAVRSEGALYGLPAVSVCEVLEWQAPVRVPLAPSHISGVIVHQGDVLTVVRLSSILDAHGTTPDGAIVILEDASSRERSALSVEAVEQVFAVAQFEIEAPPGTLSRHLQALVTGLCRPDGELVILLDPQALAPDRLFQELGGADTPVDSAC